MFSFLITAKVVSNQSGLPTLCPINRYHCDFEHLNFVAEGGFGKVFRARNKLDGMEYAIKEIKIKYWEMSSIACHLSEVKIFASLNHSNVVPYKTAWLESLLDESTGNQSLDSDDEGNGLESSDSDTSDHKYLQVPPKNWGQDETSKSILFQRFNDDENKIDDANVDAFDSSNPKSQPRGKLKRAKLYIQMSFRPQTLRGYLDERNAQDDEDFTTFHQQFVQRSMAQSGRIGIDKDIFNGSNGAVTTELWDTLEVSLNIFCQILNGLMYLQTKNVIHHDIKPPNIFIGYEQTGKLYVQLGDFGLACQPGMKHPPDSLCGTPLYAAPEQLEEICNKKVRPKNQQFLYA